MQKYRLYILLTTFIIATITFSIHSSVNAQSINKYNSEIQELEKKESSLKNKQNEINNDKSSVDNKMGKNLNSQDSVKKQIKEIDTTLATTKADIQEKESEIAVTNKEITELESAIEQLKVEIKELGERIEKREALLIDRLRSIQESGGNVPYISVILGSQNFSDLISRSTAVNSIMDQDKTIMEEHAADQLALEQKQAEVEKKRDDLTARKAEQESQRDELKTLESQLNQQVSEKEKLKEQLLTEYEELEEYSLSLEEEQQLIASQAAVVEKAKKFAESEKNRLEQEAREKQKQAEASASSGSGSSSNSSGGSSSNSSGGSSTVGSGGGGGSYVWPASGRFSSGFGPRIHPISGEKGKMHNGIDIAAPSGSPVVSAAAGVVASAGWMGGYGNTIMISHGSTTTLYAHLSSMSVSAGQTVSQGQRIGGIGSTGNSTGPHLHFEVHPGGYKNPTNPMNYLR